MLVFHPLCWHTVIFRHTAVSVTHIQSVRSIPHLGRTRPGLAKMWGKRLKNCSFVRLLLDHSPAPRHKPTFLGYIASYSGTETDSYCISVPARMALSFLGWSGPQESSLIHLLHLSNLCFHYKPENNKSINTTIKLFTESIVAQKSK